MSTGPDEPAAAEPSPAPDEPAADTRARRLVATARQTLPEGTYAVGAGLVVAAITSYVFVIVALNLLQGEAAAAFSAFWAVIFVAGPGFFLPLEQEVGRAMAHRRAQGQGAGPLVHKAARLGGIITAILAVAALATAPFLADHLYAGDLLFGPAVAVGVVAFYVMHLTRGVLAGQGRFRAYGTLLGAEGVIRLVAALVLAAAGVDRPGAYALALACAPFLAVAIALRKQRGLLEPGPDAPYSELSASLGWLLLGSVLMQCLAYAPLLGINVLSSQDEKDFAAAFASAFFIARIPVLAFQAVQGTLLPKLASLAGSGRHDEFRRGLSRLLMVVATIGVLGTIGALVLGPWAGELLFEDFDLDAQGLALLAAGSGAFIIALTLAQALMALGGHRLMAASWAVGLAVCLGIMAAISDLELRVEVGFLVGALVAAAAMTIATWTRIGRADGMGIGSLVEAIEHEPIEI
jgi:O-antigen/teichoic acid export membrane protein